MKKVIPIATMAALAMVGLTGVAEAAGVADLKVEMSGPAIVAAPGGGNTPSLAYAIKLTNNGPDASDADTKVTVTLPDAVTNFTPEAGCAATLPTITCDVGALANQANKPFNIKVDLTGGAVGDTLTTTAVATAANIDTTKPGDDTATVDTEIVANEADFGIETATVTPDPVTKGDKITYEATVSNAGPLTPRAAKVIMDLPEGITGTVGKSETPAPPATCTTTTESGAEKVTCTTDATLGTDARTFTFTGTVGQATAADITGTFSIEDGSATPVRDPDPADNTKDAASKVVEAKPAAPEIKSPVTGPIPDNKPKISGDLGVVGAKVTVHKQAGGTPVPGTDPVVCTTAALAVVTWDCTGDGSQVIPGDNVVYATQQVDAGPLSDASNAVTLTLKAPVAVPALTSITDGSTVPTDTPKLAGNQGLKDATVTVYEQAGVAPDPGDAALCSSAKLAAAGDWECAPSPKLASGGHKVYVKQAVSGDTSAASAIVNFTVAVPVPPKATLTLPATATGKTGQEVPVRLELVNTGSSGAGDPDIQDPTVTVELPAALEFVSDRMGKCTAAGPTVTCAYTGTNLPARQSEASKLGDDLTLKVKADAMDDGPIVATAQLAADPKPTSTTAFTLIREAKLAITTDPAGPDLGDIPASPTTPVDLKVTLNNDGNGSAENAGYTVTTKNAAEGYVVGDGDRNCTKVDKSHYTCSFESVAAKGKTKQLTFRTPADPAAAGQNLEFVVTPTMGGKPVPGAVTLTGKIVTAGTLKLTVDPATLDKVIAGDSQEIKATLKNDGESPAIAASFELIGFNMANVSVTGDGGKCTKGSGSYKCAFGDLAAAAEIPLVFQVVPDAGAIGSMLQVNLSPKLSGTTVEGQAVKLKATIVSPVKLDTAVEPEAAKVGDTVRFKAVVNNMAASEIQNVRIEHTLSDNLELTKVTAPCTMAGQMAICQLNPVPAGGSFPTDDAVWIEAKVKALATGDLTDSVVATASIPGSGNDIVTEKATLKSTGPVPAQADLKISAKLRKDLVKPGDQIRHTITVENLGPDVAPASTMTLEHHGPIASVEASGPCKADGTTKVTCDVPELKPGSQTWGMGFVATTAKESGEVRSTATVTPSSNTIDKDLTNNTAETTAKVLEVSDLQVQATGSPEKAVAGKDSVTYSISVLALGPAVETKGAKLTGTLPAGLEKVTPVPDAMKRVRADQCKVTGTELACDLGTIKLGDAVKKIVVRGLVKATATGTMKAAFKATSEMPTEDPSGASAEVATTVTASADVAVTGKVGKLRKGKAGTYTLTVTNKGPSNAVKVSLADKLPKYLTYSKVKGSGCKKSGNGIACAWSTLKPAQKVAITLTVKVSKTGKGKAVNTATVKATTPDPSKTNNTAKISATITK